MTDETASDVEVAAPTPTYPQRDLVTYVVTMWDKSKLSVMSHDVVIHDGMLCFERFEYYGANRFDYDTTTVFAIEHKGHMGGQVKSIRVKGVAIEVDNSDVEQPTLPSMPEPAAEGFGRSSATEYV